MQVYVCNIGILVWNQAIQLKTSLVFIVHPREKILALTTALKAKQLYTFYHQSWNDDQTFSVIP